MRDTLSAKDIAHDGDYGVTAISQGASRPAHYIDGPRGFRKLKRTVLETLWEFIAIC